MKITKITTQAFPVSQQKEKQIENKLKADLRRKLSLQRGKTRIHKGYLPLGCYHLKRREKDKIRENKIYVDLKEGHMIYLKRKQITKLDLPQRIIDLEPKTVQTLGSLLRDGQQLREDLDPGDVTVLWGRGLVKIYKEKLKTAAAFLIDELAADPTGKKTQTKEHVKTAYPLPDFQDTGYDLKKHITPVEEILEDYQKEGIQYATDTMEEMLENLFTAEAQLTGITYLPYLKAEYTCRGYLRNTEPHYPLPKNPREKKKPGNPIKPIALATDIGACGSIPLEAATIDYSDVVGMQEAKEEIEKTLIRPLREPVKAKKLRKKAGGSILLYGPPGCGKTHLAKAAVGETGLPFLNVNLAELAACGAKKGAEALHKVFREAAKNAPAIIFFDELDAIGSRRAGDQDNEGRMGVTQLLVELDGAESLTENVLVIAATNTPWSLDPALRRSGRFTRQVYVGPPDSEARQGLFEKYLEKQADIDYRKLAEKTEGYSAADIKNVCDQATEKLWTQDEIDHQDLLEETEKQKTTLTAWYRLAEKELRQSGESDLYKEMAGCILKEAGGIEKQGQIQVGFKDVGGMLDVKEEIRRSILYPREYPELAEKYGKKLGGAILFYGPPGCGKTHMARATAGECNAAFYNVDLTDVLSEEDSVRKIKEIFERAKRNTPAVIFFDEFDALAGKREQATAEERRLVNQLLIELDGFQENPDILVMAATNMPWLLDPALKRSGRFTTKIFVDAPDYETRKEVFRIHTRDKPLHPEVDLEALADITEGYSCADLKAVCEKAAEYPWDEAVSGGKARDIGMEDFLRAIEKQEPNTLEWFKTAREQEKTKEEEEMEVEILGPEDDDGFSSEKKELEEKIALAKQRYCEGVIDKSDYKLIVLHYQKKLVDLEIKSRGEEPEEEAAEKLEKKDEGMVWMKDVEWSVGTHPSGKTHYRIRSMRGDLFKD